MIATTLIPRIVESQAVKPSRKMLGRATIKAFKDVSFPKLWRVKVSSAIEQPGSAETGTESALLDFPHFNLPVESEIDLLCHLPRSVYQRETPGTTEGMWIFCWRKGHRSSGLYP